ncbi:MAG: peptide chain release factor 3 [Fimbriimonas sp.]
MTDIQREAARRKTFAIISHPDAGKTTLPEKLLLYGGAIQLAGSVKARRNQKKATSDWMELEKQRGISITSTVLQFEFADHVLNLLDTPGHEDFSADTYRTLTAADSAVMLIDNAKGVEAQTRKLYAVCSRRGIPIFTFVNKMDHPGKGPLALLTEVEDVLQIRTTPVNWPIGQGSEFRGVFDRATQMVHMYQKTAHGASKAKVDFIPLAEAEEAIGREAYKTLMEDIELLDIAGDSFDHDRVSRGELTPVFFGSAISNFGVELFLRSFLTMAPPPAPRISGEKIVEPGDEFSGFVFKIQANMDPQHRDRIAFMRVVSGRFEKDMDVVHTRTGKKLRLTRPQRLFAQERETVEEAYPGDIVGLTNPGAFRLGDTLSLDQTTKFEEVPSFVPEVLATLQNQDVSRLKQFEKGVQQLTEEGLVDVFMDRRSQRREPILGVVGRLQFEVVQFRMISEYGVKTALEPLPYTLVKWVSGPEKDLDNAFLGNGARLLEDAHNRPVMAATSEWNMDFVKKQNKNLTFYDTPEDYDQSLREKGRAAA